MNIKHIIIILAAILISNTAFAQWFSDNSIWYFNKQEQLAYQAHGYTKYIVEKDTIINLINAKMILITGETYNGNEIITNPIYVYEDNNKVYYWNNTTFKLMYDFNLNIGDTLNTEITNNCDSVSPMIIDSIKIVNIGGVDLRKQYISFTGYDSGSPFINSYEILEFIGYEQNFIFAPSCFESEGFVYTGLRCFSNESFEYKSYWWTEYHDELSCDELINSSYLKDNYTYDNIVTYPNPAKNILFISSENQKIINVFIINYLGEVVYMSKEYNNLAQININNLHSGIYNIKVILNSNKIINKKFIKK